MRCHSFIKQYLNASNADEVEHLKSELESVKAENAALQKELAELKVCSHPLPASCPCSARLFRLLVHVADRLILLRHYRAAQLRRSRRVAACDSLWRRPYDTSLTWTCVLYAATTFRR